MPGKGRRVASRQAQLGRRRRRQNRGPGGTQTSERPAEDSRNQAAKTAATTVEEPPEPAPDGRATAPSRSASPAAQPRPARTRAERPPAYNYIAPELRRIVILAGILTIVLIVLAFFI